MQAILPRRSVITLAVATLLVSTAPGRADWRNTYKELHFGISSSENERDAVGRYQPFAAYLTKKLGVPVHITRGTDYAAVIEAMRSDHVEFAQIGAANYALGRKVMGERITPVAVTRELDGATGYYSVIAVRADSRYKSLDDLKGKTLAFADPNSTSGYAVPTHFLKKNGYDPKTFFGNAPFSGSHELGIVGVVNGTFDAAATSWVNEQRGNIQRMEEKGMVPKGSTRIIWKSDLIPNGPFVVRGDLPEELKRLFVEALFAFPQEDPAALQLLSDGKWKALAPARHEDYIEIIAITQENTAERRRRGP
jgi:phosphonate transport system substrate-binding protein